MFKTRIEELTAEDIDAMNASRENTRENNHRYGGQNFMDMALEGSRKLSEEFANTDEYKIDLGDSE
jgi:hypothetical protein